MLLIAPSVHALNPVLFDPTLQAVPVVVGLSQPVGMAFLGQNDFLVIEKASGQVRRVTGGVVTGTVLDLAVNSGSERGLLGIALHPSFPANPGVYLYWTESTTGSDSVAVAETSLLGNRVDRFDWNSSNQTLSFSHNVVRLRALQNDGNNPANPQQGNHNGGQIRFGPDGKLYIFVGDVGRRGWTQNLPNGPFLTAPFIDDAFGGPASDNAHLTGVILRLNDDGTPVATNPFFAAGGAMGGEVGANIQKIYSYGHRNGFGLAFDPVAGNLWASENGDDSFDEINRIVAGGNYGWVQTMGPVARIAQFKKIEMSLFNPPATIGAIQQVRYPTTRIAYTPGAVLSRMLSLPGAVYQDPKMSWRYAVSPAGLGFVSGNALGAAYNGTLWSGAARTTSLTGGSLGTVPGGYLMVFRLSSDRASLDLSADPRLADGVADNGIYPPAVGTSPGAPGFKFDATESETLVIGQDFGVAADIQPGPDGALYVVSLTDGMVYRISQIPQ